MANRTVYEIVGEARSYVQAMSQAERAGLGLDKRNELLARHGVKTTEVFREQLVEINALKQAWKGDALAMAQLERRERDLIRTMQSLNGELDEQNAALERNQRESREAATGIGRVGEGFKGAALAVRGFLALEAVQFLRNLAVAGLDAERTLNIMRSSIAAANREFGDSVGTVEEWEGRITELSGKFTHLSETAIRGAVTRTVDMTKRLGLNADQMQVVIERAANLAIGKTDLEGAIERVTSALRGEAESAEFLGLSLGETALKTFLVAQGFDEKLIPKLTDAQKNQIRYLMLLDQTNEIQGRTNELLDETATKVERVNRQWIEAKETLGGLLLDFADYSIWLDLLGGDLERVIAKQKDFFTLDFLGLGVGATEALDARRQKEAALAALEDRRKREAAETADESERELSTEERIAKVLAEIQEQARKVNEKKKERKTLLETEQAKYEDLRATLNDLTGKDAQRLATQAAINAELERQVKLIGDALRAPDRAAVRLGDVSITPGLDARQMRKEGRAQLEAQAKERREEEGPMEILPEQLRGIPEATQTAMDESNAIMRQGLETMRVNWASWLSGTEEGLEFLGDVAGQVFGGFASLAQTAFELSGKEQKKYFTLFKAFSVAEAAASTFVAINQALATVKPTVPFGIAAAAAVGIQGAANVAKILALQPGSTGGAGAGATPAVATPAVASSGVTSRTQTSAVGGVVAPTPDGVGRDIVVRDQNDALLSAINANTRSVERAIDKIPDSLTAEISGENIVVSYDRTKNRQTRGLGQFA